MSVCGGVDDAGVLEVKAVSSGVVVIKSVETGQYLSMGKDGRLVGSVSAIINITGDGCPHPNIQLLHLFLSILDLRNRGVLLPGEHGGEPLQYLPVAEV